VAAAAGGTVHKLVTADGTYATQSAFSAANTDKTKKQAERPPLRKYLMEGDFFIGASIGSTMTKLALRYSSLVHDEKKQNRYLYRYLYRTDTGIDIDLLQRCFSCWYRYLSMRQ
jgi:hypothetical protein